MSLLYPRITNTLAEELANKRRKLNVDEAKKLSDVEHEDEIYTPTGGTDVSKQKLQDILQGINELAENLGFPQEIGGDEIKRKFDAQSGEFLHKLMKIAPAEASKNGVWEFLTCVMFPHLVIWRFPGSGHTNTRRFTGGRERNVFQRVWWRAEILVDPDSKNPYWLLYELNEDELVQIMERPNLSGNKVLAREISKMLLDYAERFGEEKRRMDLMREVQKRLRRRFPLINFDALGQNDIKEILDEIFEDTIEAMEGLKVASF